jgi:prepilin-type N-terminal cleavage/methylation domain-containing protein
MRNTKNAFTLVELIVVITILAILGTIAFISLQGYSADARNSKRTSDLGNIQSAISLKQVEGVPLMSFVSGTGSDVSGIALAGSGGTDATYAAGTPAYTVLNVAAKDFKDPSEKEYRIGATEAKAGVFQIAATMEVDGTDTALVNGTFVARGTGTVVTDSVDGLTATLADTAANSFKAGDYVVDASATTAKITKVSRDGVTLTLDTAVAAGTLALQNPESAGLIADKTTDTTAVVNDGTTALAY